MTGLIQSVVRTVDALTADVYLSSRAERPALMTFLFHSLFSEKAECSLNRVDPLQRTTVDELRQFIEYYQSHGYEFVSPADVLTGLRNDKRYAMLTFDDGYHNNTLALPLLRKYKVPATFFISARHVAESKGYWWDVLYRERKAQGMADKAIWREAVSMKTMRTDEMEARLVTLFGARAFSPRGDIDRPFSPSELAEFAADPFVHIGNHTANHAILLNYDDDDARAELQTAQDMLTEMTGKTPIAIAYPNGGHSDRVIELCRQVGLKMGFTVRPQKQTLPIRDGADLFHLGRFTPHGEIPILRQCKTYRSDFLFYGFFRDAYLKLIRGGHGDRAAAPATHAAA